MIKRTTTLSKWLLSLLLAICMASDVSAQTNIVVPTGGTAGNTNGSGADPVCDYFNFIRYQVVYTVAELSAAGLASGNTITGIGWNITEDPGVLANYTIRMAHTTATNSAAHDASTLTTVKSAFTFDPVAGSYNMITLDASFTWNGTDNLLVDICTGTNPFATPYGGVQAKTGITNGSRRIRCDACGSQCSSTTNTANTTKPYLGLDVTASSCSGAPVGGTTVSSSNPVCSGASFTLSVTGGTSGVSGLTYQWQSADDAAFTINVVNLGTSPTQVASQTSDKYYRREITCTFSGLSDYSSVILVTMDNVLNCYCATSYSNCSGDGIVNVVLNTLSNPSAGCPGSGNYTYFFPGVSQTTLLEGFTYTLSVTVQTDPNQWTNAWIDFNRDGVLSASEVLGTTVNPGSSGTANITFTVPSGVSYGITRLRIRGGVDVTFTGSNACGANVSSSYGEVQDYDITLASPPNCSGTPTAGTASILPASVCQFNATTLTLTGYTSGFGGITFQWKTSSTSGGPYTDISGANTPGYNYIPTTSGTEYIVCEVTCTYSGLSDVSNEVILTVDPSPSGTASGPTSGLTYQNLNYVVAGYPIGTTFQWEVSTTSCASGFTNITGATTDNLVAVANASGTYYIRCMLTNAGCSAPSNCVTLVVTVAGDNVCDAIPVSVGVNGPFSNQTATGQTGEVVPPGTGCSTQTGWCNNTGAVNSVWFTFTPTVSGSYSFHLANNPPGLNYFDSQLALYSVGNCNNFGTFSLIAANDDSLSTPYHSYIAPVCLTAGTTYYLLADGYSSTVNNAFGIRIVQVSTLTANISGNSSICLSNSAVVTLNFTGTAPFTYTVSGSGGPYNGVAPGVTENVTVIPVASGVQNYTITAFGDASCPVGGAGTGTATVNVSTAPPAGSIGSVNAPASACSGSVHLITAGHSITGTFIQFSWNTGSSSSTVLFSDNIGGPFVAGPYLTSTNQVYAQFGALGASSSGYNICVQAVNGCGSSNNKCNFIRGTVTVPAGITGASVQCSGATGQLYSVSGPLPAGVETFVWSFSVGGAVITSLDPPLNSQVSIDFPAFSTGTLSVQAGLLCLGSSLSPARNLSLSNATLTPAVPTGPTKVCPGNSYNYSVPAVAGATGYNWTVPANASITGGAGTNSITVQFNATPINFVNAIISVNTTSTCGAISGTTSKTTSSMVPSTPSVISGQTSGVCDAPYNYSVTAVSGVTYNWSLPAGASGSSSSNIINVTFSNSYASGTISVTGTAAGCAVASNPRSLNVSGAPATPASITALFPPCNGGPGQFQSATSFGATGYIWTVPANGTTLDAGQGTTTIDVTWGTGNGNVTVKADNLCGSSGLRTLYYVPGCRLAEEDAAGISSLTVYPNPAHTQATVAFKAAEQGSYMLIMTDVTGRTVRSMVTTAQAGVHQTDINLNDLAKGMYLIELRSNSGTEVQKLIVE